MIQKKILIFGLALVSLLGIFLYILGKATQLRSTNLSVNNTTEDYFPELPKNLSYINESHYINNLISQWQSCRNEENGISYRFPNDWKILDDSKINTVREDCKGDNIILSPNPDSSDPRIEIQYLGNSYTMEEYYEQNPDLFGVDPLKNGGYFAFDDMQGVRAVRIKDGDTKITYIFRAKDIFLVKSVNIPDLYLYTFIRGIGFPQFVTDISVEDWKNSCRNEVYGYEVRYPDGIKVFTGDLIVGINQYDNCKNNFKDANVKLSQIVLSPLTHDFVGQYPTGISILSTPNVQKQTFADKDILKRTSVGNTEVVWINEYHGEFHKGSTRYEIDLAKDISPETIDAILSTFRFLP